MSSGSRVKGAHLTDNQWAALMSGGGVDEDATRHLETCDDCKRLSGLFSAEDFAAMLEQVTRDAAKRRGEVVAHLQPERTKSPVHEAPRLGTFAWPLAAAAALVGVMLGYVLKPADIILPTALESASAEAAQYEDPETVAAASEKPSPDRPALPDNVAFKILSLDGEQKAKLVLDKMEVWDRLAQDAGPDGVELIGYRPAETPGEKALTVGRLYVEPASDKGREAQPK